MSVVGQRPRWSSCTLDARVTCYWSDLCVGGTSWLAYRSYVTPFADAYYTEMLRCLRTRRQLLWKAPGTAGMASCLDDQNIHTALLHTGRYHVLGVKPLNGSRFLHAGEGEGWAKWLTILYRKGQASGVDATEFFGAHAIYGERFRALMRAGSRVGCSSDNGSALGNPFLT